MSSTNRGGARVPGDVYPTPSWCVRRLTEACSLPGGRWLEPCAGDGAIVAAASRDDIAWTAVELRAECVPPLQRLGAEVVVGDFLAAPLAGPFAVAITNPPFSLAQPVLERCFELADHVVMLLRLNFLASEARSTFMRRSPPDVWVLPNRPSFDGRGTDSAEYAWFVWQPLALREEGRIRVLATTPVGERGAGREPEG